MAHDRFTRCWLSNARIVFLSTRNRFTLFDEGSGGVRDSQTEEGNRLRGAGK